MSVAYIPVQWTRVKWVYDAVLLLMLGLYLWAFLGLGVWHADHTRPVAGPIPEARAFGSAAFFMLSFVLAIGPLARLDRRFLPLLYNRRHFGVLTAATAVAHAGFVLDWYFNFAPLTQGRALLAANTSWGQLLGFPFEALGLFALLVLILLAATSHDFWLSFLTAPVWKAMHLMIYPAYAAVVGHVALGALQAPGTPFLAVAVALAAGAVAGLHWAAARAEPTDPPAGPPARAAGHWVPVAAPAEIAEATARIVRLGPRERVAVFRNQGRFSAISNACAHQNGPLGEGRIIDGCVTCPWHGFQYRVEDGRSPAPFTEKVPTYRLRFRDGLIWVDARANPPGTPVAPLEIGEAPP